MIAKIMLRSNLSPRRARTAHYGIRCWKYLSTRVSPAGTLIANASPAAVWNSMMLVLSFFGP
jgi:hypothetical protein